MDKTVTEWQIMFTMTSGLEDFYIEDEDEYNEKFQDLIDDGDLQYVEQCIRKDYVWNEELEDWDEDYVEVLYDAENYDDYKDTQRGSVANEYKYKVSSYYDMKYLGLEDTFYTNDWSEVEDEAHKKLMQGNCVLIQNLITGKEIKLNPDEYDETFDGEFLVKPDQLEESKQDGKLVKTFNETDYGWGNNETTYYGELNDGNYYVCLGETAWTSMTIYNAPITKKYLDYLYREDDEDTELEAYYNNFNKEHDVTSKYSLDSKEQIEQELNVDYLGYEDLDESKDTTNGEDEWWKKNGERAVKYVANETPEAVVNLFGYGNKDDNAAWDMYMSSTAKSIALELLHYLGQEEFEKVLDEYERNLNESYVSYEEPYSGKKMSKAQWKEIYDKEINHDPNNDGWETFEDWWYDMTERDRLIVKENVEDDKLNANSALHSLGIDKSSKLIQELDTALEDNDEVTIKKIINKFKQDLSANDFNSFIKTYYPEYKEVINKLSENRKTEASGKISDIQGLEYYSESEIKQMAIEYIREALLYADEDPDDLEIVDMNIYGSRKRGTAKKDSDLDIVFEYKGDFREDDLFNLLNDEEEPLMFDDVVVDFNPICAERSGDMNSFMARAKAYDDEILNKKKTESVDTNNLFEQANKLYNENAISAWQLFVIGQIVDYIDYDLEGNSNISIDDLVRLSEEFDIEDTNVLGQLSQFIRDNLGSTTGKLNEDQYENERRKGKPNVSNIAETEYEDNIEWYKEHIKDFKDEKDFITKNIANIASEYNLKEDRAQDVCAIIYKLATSKKVESKYADDYRGNEYWEINDLYNEEGSITEEDVLEELKKIYDSKQAIEKAYEEITGKKLDDLDESKSTDDIEELKKEIAEIDEKIKSLEHLQAAYTGERETYVYELQNEIDELEDEKQQCEAEIKSLSKEKKTESKKTDRQLRTNYKKAMERELEKVQDAIANAGPGDISDLEDRRDFLMDKLDQIDSDLEKKEESTDVTIDDVKDMFNNLPDNIKSYLENTDNVPTKEIEGTLWFDITQEEKEQLEQFVNYIDTISEDVWRKWDKKTKLNMSSYANNADRICRNCTLKLESKDIKTESKDNKVEVEHYHLEDMGGHTMAVFGSLKDGRYFAGNEEVMTLYDEDIWPQYCEDDPDTTMWEKEHTLLSTSRYDTNKENLQLYYDIISQTSFFDEDDLVWFKEHLGLDNNDVADKKNESKLVEKTNIELQEEIEEKINNAIYQYLIKDGYETEESAKEFIKDYVVVKTWYEDMTSASSAEILEKYLAVEVRAELDYDDLSTLSTYLDNVVQKYDASSYFDFITGGTIRAYIQVDTKKTEDIIRTDIPNGNVNVSLQNARETLAELEDLEDAVDNMQYADAISEKFADDLAEFEDGPIVSEKEKLTKAIGDTETRELNNRKKSKRGRKKTEGKEVNRANALLDLINEVYDGMGDMAELAEWAEILADDYNIDIDDESMETDEIMLTAFNKMNDNDFRNEVNNFIESLSENDGIEYLKDTLHTYPRNLKHIVKCLNTIKPYASEPDKIDTAIEELQGVNMNLRTTAEEFQEYLHDNFKPWTVLGTTTGPRTYVNLFEVPTDYDIVGADYFNYADRPSDMLDHIGYGWKQDGNNIVADLIGFKDSVKVGDNYAVAVYDQAPVKYGYSATIDSSNKEAKFKEMANALMSKAKEIKEKYNLKESKTTKTEAFWDDGKLYNYKGIDIQQSISDRGEKLYSILNNQKPFSIPDFSTLSAAKKYIDDNNLKSYKEKQESKKTEAVNIEDVNIEKEKVADDIQTAGVKDMIDTEKELEDGIKKEVYQFAKQQGLDLEKLRKQGVELETIADTIDTVIGDMVSKSAIEYMDQTNQEINWDFEIVGNDIKIVWEKK